MKLAVEYFSNDIMPDIYGKSIYQPEIGKFTKYLNGWCPVPDQKYQP